MIFFRVDSNKNIASGHIMRCMSIAQAFQDMGLEVTFIVADNNPVLMLDQKGVKYIVLHSCWDNLMSEVNLVQEILKPYVKPLLIIDTYQVCRDYIESLEQYAKICYLGSKLENLGPLSALINYSTNIDYEFYKKNYQSSTKLLLGPKYAPLRKEFSQMKHKLRCDDKCRILLTLGNTNPNCYMEKILYEIIKLNCFQLIEVKVVIGGMFDNKECLRNKFGKFSNIHFYENVKLMSELMSECDLAVSANGTTVYELAAAKIPTITFAMVDEQYKSAIKLFELGVVDYCGEIFLTEQLCLKKIIEKIEWYVLRREEREALAVKSNLIIDGYGCQRIVSTLLSL